MSSRFTWYRVKKVFQLSAATGAVGYASFTIWKTNELNKVFASAPALKQKPEGYLKKIPTREEQLNELQKGEEYDILIIGGGATGCGVALDSASRGLKTAMIEYDDFSSGTSSRSTKLIHGGVRYLQKAIFGLDYEQYKMVKEALVERKNLIDIAPHLARSLPIMLPVYNWFKVPYYFAGIKAYDLVAGKRILQASYFLGKQRSLESFPMLKPDKLCGGIVYYDGQHNDARMNIAIAMTSVRMGANVANHVECIDLIKTKVNGKEKVSGAVLKDRVSGKIWNVRAKCVINATGPFSDLIRKMDDDNCRELVIPSVGIHVVLPDYYSPTNMGLLDPSTSDGRVIFFLPWEGATVAGTTDAPSKVTHHPQPQESDIQFILKEIRDYLASDVNVRRGDVRSAWAGLRPLVKDPDAKNTQSIARNHVIFVSDKGLLTIAGGKWTTYRHMAEETVNKAVENFGLTPKKQCQTLGLLLEGGHEYTPTTYIRLVQDFGMDTPVAQHLAMTYGDRAFKVARASKLTGKKWPVIGKRLHVDYPYIDGEVRYAIMEYARTVTDVIARRLRIAFINVSAAEEVIPMVAEIMAEELKWSKSETAAQIAEAKEFLDKEMGGKIGRESSHSVPLDFTKKEIDYYVQQFKKLDNSSKGYITVNDLRPWLNSHGEFLSESDIHDVLNEVDLNKNGQIDMSEYLLVMAAVKKGVMGTNRFAIMSKMSSAKQLDSLPSGGGV